jgi:hypothetical protein
MTLRVCLLIGVTAAVLTVAVIAWSWFNNGQRRVVAEARSPDGSWGVAVVGQKMLLGLGGIEVVVEIHDGSGRPLPYPGTFVVGVSSDWAGAQRDFGRLSCDDAKAVACGQTLLKKDYFGR